MMILVAVLATLFNFFSIRSSWLKITATGDETERSVFCNEACGAGVVENIDNNETKSVWILLHRTPTTTNTCQLPVQLPRLVIKTGVILDWLYYQVDV